MMKHYWFEVIDEDSENCGEEFLVYAATLPEATEIARKTFETREVKFYATVSEAIAEMSGLDEY